MRTSTRKWLLCEIPNVVLALLGVITLGICASGCASVSFGPVSLIAVNNHGSESSHTHAHNHADTHNEARTEHNNNHHTPRS